MSLLESINKAALDAIDSLASPSSTASDIDSVASPSSTASDSSAAAPMQQQKTFDEALSTARVPMDLSFIHNRLVQVLKAPNSQNRGKLKQWQADVEKRLIDWASFSKEFRDKVANARTLQQLEDLIPTVPSSYYSIYSGPAPSKSNSASSIDFATLHDERNKVTRKLDRDVRGVLDDRLLELVDGEKDIDTLTQLANNMPAWGSSPATLRAQERLIEMRDGVAADSGNPTKSSETDSGAPLAQPLNAPTQEPEEENKNTMPLWQILPIAIAGVLVLSFFVVAIVYSVRRQSAAKVPSSATGYRPLPQSSMM